MGVTPDQIKIGFLFSDSGAGGTTFAAARSGVDARLGLANERGGVHGREVVYEWRDDESTASGNANAARELVSEPVFGIIASTTVIGGSADYLEQQGVPVIGLVAEPEVWASHRNMFAWNYGADFGAIVRFVQGIGGTRPMVVLPDNTSVGAEAAQQIEQEIRDAGLTSVGAIPFAVGSDSPDRLAQQIVAAGADSLISLLTPDGLIGVVDALRAVDFPIYRILSLVGYDYRLVEAVGPALAGVSFLAATRPFEAKPEVPAMREFRQAMARFAPQTTPADQTFTLGSYIDTDLFLRGLEGAGACPTRESFAAALRSITGYDAGGLIEKVNLSEDLGRPVPCYAFVRINSEGTKFEVVADRICGH